MSSKGINNLITMFCWLQEIAMNLVWSQEEYNAMKEGPGSASNIA